MATTTNLGLNKPARTDNINVVTAINNNMDVLDAAIGALPSGSNLQTEISGKADKVASPTNGNFAGLDGNGNLTDSGKKAADFATASDVGTVPSGKTVQGQIDDLADTLAPAFAQGTANEARSFVTNDNNLYFLSQGHTDETFANTTKYEKTVGGVLKDLDDRDIAQDGQINEMNSYVNYGYDTNVDLAGGGTGTTAISVKRNKTEYILNGSPTTSVFWCKISNNVSRVTGATSVKNFTNPISLKKGHKYRITIKKISGSCTVNDPSFSPSPLVSVYKEGESSANGEYRYTLDGSIREFTADGSNYNLALYIPSGKTFTNYKCSIVMEDLSADNNFKNDRLSVKESISESAAVMEFNDGADTSAIDLTVGIEPVQSFNGYDHPWAGGAGKNLLDYESPYIYYKNSAFSYELTENGIIVKTSGSSSYGYVDVFELTSEMVGTNFVLSYVSDKTPVNLPALCICDSENRSRKQQSYTIVADDVGKHLCVYLSTTSGTGNITYTNLQVEAGDSATEWEPYTNVCPITGWTQAKVTRTGKNILGGDGLKNAVLASLPNATVGDGTISFASSATVSQDHVPFVGTYNDVVYEYAFKENTQYTIILTGKNTAENRSNIRLYYTDGTTVTTAIATFSTTEKSKSIYVTTANKTVKSLMKVTNGGTTTLYVDECGIFEGVLTEQDFEAYSGNTYAITFPTPPGTVYGGTLEIAKDGIATLTVTDAEIASYDGETLPSTWISDRDVYEIGTTPSEEAQVVYKLASPVTYTFTAEQITSLLGKNTIWCDTGDVLGADYTADTKTYIDNLFATIIPATGVSF